MTQGGREGDLFDCRLQLGLWLGLWLGLGLGLKGDFPDCRLCAVKVQKADMDIVVRDHSELHYGLN